MFFALRTVVFLFVTKLFLPCKSFQTFFQGYWFRCSLRRVDKKTIIHWEKKSHQIKKAYLGLNRSQIDRNRKYIIDKFNFLPLKRLRHWDPQQMPFLDLTNTSNVGPFGPNQWQCRKHKTKIPWRYKVVHNPGKT